MKARTAVLIDDDPDDLEILKEVLGKVDSSILCFSFIYPDEAITLLTSRVIIPDFIFIDINMPRKGGPECLVELRKLGLLDKVVITMVSTSMPATSASELKAKGASFAVQKPYKVHDYIELVSGIVGTIPQGL